MLDRKGDPPSIKLVSAGLGCRNTGPTVSWLGSACCRASLAKDLALLPLPFGSSSSKLLSLACHLGVVVPRRGHESSTFLRAFHQPVPSSSSRTLWAPTHGSLRPHLTRNSPCPLFKGAIIFLFFFSYHVHVLTPPFVSFCFAYFISYGSNAAFVCLVALDLSRKTRPVGFLLLTVL